MHIMTATCFIQLKKYEPENHFLRSQYEDKQGRDALILIALFWMLCLTYFNLKLEYRTKKITQTSNK